MLVVDGPVWAAIRASGDAAEGAVPRALGGALDAMALFWGGPLKVPFLRVPEDVMAKALARHSLKLELTWRALQVALSHFRDDADHRAHVIE